MLLNARLNVSMNVCCDSTVCLNNKKKHVNQLRFKSEHKIVLEHVHMYLSEFRRNQKFISEVFWIIKKDSFTSHWAFQISVLYLLIFNC